MGKSEKAKKEKSSSRPKGSPGKTQEMQAEQGTSGQPRNEEAVKMGD